MLERRDSLVARMSIEARALSVNSHCFTVSLVHLQVSSGLGAAYVTKVITVMMLVLVNNKKRFRV